VSHTIRVDREVKLELYKRRLPTERNHNGVIVRALEEQRLEAKLNERGLTTPEMSRLWDLRALRGAL
jgi:hypothetical protein